MLWEVGRDVQQGSLSSAFQTWLFEGADLEVEKKMFWPCPEE